MKTKTTITTPAPISAGLKSIIQNEAAQKQHKAQSDKYASIDSLQKSQKIDALKDLNLNPHLLHDPYDSLANSLYRWKTVAADAEKQGYSQDQKNQVALNYYHKMIMPFYAKLYKQSGTNPMGAELWLKESFNVAKNYNIEDAYNSSIIHDLRHGGEQGVAALREAGASIENLLGNLTNSPIEHTDEEYSPYYKRAASPPAHGFFDSGTGRNFFASKYFSMAQRLHENESEHEFWAQALPSHKGWTHAATSFIAEQGAQLPLYVAMDEVAGPAKAASLTEHLSASPLGKWVLGSLMAGTEGLAYGTATRKQDDKGQAWRDAVGFAVFHNIFNIGGAITKKLSDVAGGAMAERVARRAEVLDLAQEGKRPATPMEKYQDHTAEVSNNLVVMGVHGQKEVFYDALHHIEDMEKRGLNKGAIKAYELGLMKKDPARWGPVLSSASFIRDHLNGTKVSDMKPWSAEEKALSDKISLLITDAGEHLNTHSQAIQEHTAEAVEENAKTPAAKNTLEVYMAKAMTKVAQENPTAAKMMNEAQIKALATKMLAADTQKAAAIAEKKLSFEPGEEAADIEARRKNTPKLESKTSRTTDKYGQPAVSYRMNPDFKAKLQVYIKTAKAAGQSLRQFFQDMSDEDFKNDLQDHFYPKSLKKAGVFFEHANTPEGRQNPNFLAFMYNYLDTMPKEFGQELEQRLIDTLKVQKYMKGRSATEPQLTYYAKAMYNHVDNFLGSGRYPAEHNIFRSSQANLWKPTIWQRQLLVEKMMQEEKNLRDMFSGNRTGLRAALTAFRDMSLRRMKMFDAADKNLKSQEHIQDIDTSISDLITQSGDYERIPF